MSGYTLFRSFREYSNALVTPEPGEVVGYRFRPDESGKSSAKTLSELAVSEPTLLTPEMKSALKRVSRGSDERVEIRTNDLSPETVDKLTAHDFWDGIERCGIIRTDPVRA